MATFVRAAAAADVAPGTGVTVEVNGRQIALFNVDGTFHALAGECPHRGGPLGDGELEGCVVTCPWHSWQFDVTSGESLTDDLKAERYEVRVEGGEVLVAV
ncbi:MAG TPA: Rieske (2Fe-2S) protein [Candidatus Binatia bacterium]|nr:Rieske (2Fe-2S) protein [Candidatus Binatia bacterium]